jgi:hypothetical protein
MKKIVRNVPGTWALVACALVSQTLISGRTVGGAPLNGASGAPPAAALLAAADAAGAADLWWEIRLAGQPTGWMRESAARSADGSSRTTQEMLFVINRLGSKVEIRTLATLGEDAAGRLQAVHTEVSSSRQATVLDGIRTAAGLELRTATGGRSYSRIVPLDGELVGPQGVAALCRSRLHAAGDTITYLAFAPEAAAVRRTTRTVASVAPRGGQAAIEVEERNDLTPSVSRLWLDARGEMIETADVMPFGEVETRRASPDAARRAAAGSERT